MSGKRDARFGSNVFPLKETVMCSGCKRVWSFLHVLWSVLYVTSGAAQLVAGIFFLLAIPSLILGCNLITGLWNICMGIGVGMVACCAQVTPRRQEYLLYMIISIMMANVVNTVLTEWGFYTEDLPKLLQKHHYHMLVQYASFATRIAAAAVIVGTLVDSQLTFCSMQATRLTATTTSNNNAKKKLRGSHEQVSDIEYIIPRPKSSGTSKQQVYNAYNTQSWVFEADNLNAGSHAGSVVGGGCAAALHHGPPFRPAESPYLKLAQDGHGHGRPAAKRVHAKKKGDLANGVVLVADTTYLIDNPMVHVDEVSDDSTSNSDRKLGYMKSFSRSTSPAVLSASSSQISLSARPSALPCQTVDVPIYHQSTQAMAPSPKTGQVQYASLMKELQKAIGGKKEPSILSPPDHTGGSHADSQSEGQSSDAEFSKELEAALQLIQDLESPNTIDTPSEDKSHNDEQAGDDEDEEVMAEEVQAWRDCEARSRSDSEKTLAEIGSPLTECPPEMYTFKPSPTGKSARIVVQYSDSQSTSGYSSPTHNKSTPKCWSTTSSLNGSNSDLGKTLSYTIHNTKSTAVISLFTPANDARKKGKSVTLVNITGDNQPIHESSMHIEPATSPTTLTDRSSDHLTHYYNNNINNNNISNNNNNNHYEYNAHEISKLSPTRNNAVGSSWNVKSLLRRKKQSVPKLCPELEGAIVKSESLAYLSELELLARHQRNKDIQRQIEQRVQQQLGTPWSDND